MTSLLINKEYRFYGRRVGRKLSDSSSLALKQGEDYHIIKLNDFTQNNPKSLKSDLYALTVKGLFLKLDSGVVII